MPPDRRPVTPAGFAVVGSEMVGFTLAGVAIDWLAGTVPWATAVLTILGLVAALMHLARMVKKNTSPPTGTKG